MGNNFSHKYKPVPMKSALTYISMSVYDPKEDQEAEDDITHFFQDVTMSTVPPKKELEPSGSR
jgi:hypothetical protein